MRLSFLSQVFLVITLGAFLGTGMLQDAWPVPTAASSDTSMTMTQADDSGAPMPCKGMLPHCMTDQGCIFMIGLPAPTPIQAVTFLSWSRVSYGELTQIADGLTRKPALDPPIFLG